jgi:hypothetical protein
MISLSSIFFICIDIHPILISILRDKNTNIDSFLRQNADHQWSQECSKET